MLAKLDAQPEDNYFSQSLTEGSVKIIDELSALRGAAFDKRYAENELSYHQAVNGLMANSFIPNIENAEMFVSYTTEAKSTEGGNESVAKGSSHPSMVKRTICIA